MNRNQGGEKVGKLCFCLTKEEEYVKVTRAGRRGEGHEEADRGWVVDGMRRIMLCGERSGRWWEVL